MKDEGSADCHPVVADGVLDCQARQGACYADPRAIEVECKRFIKLILIIE